MVGPRSRTKEARLRRQRCLTTAKVVRCHTLVLTPEQLRGRQMLWLHLWSSELSPSSCWGFHAIATHGCRAERAAEHVWVLAKAIGRRLFQIS